MGLPDDSADRQAGIEQGLTKLDQALSEQRVRGARFGMDANAQAAPRERHHRVNGSELGQLESHARLPAALGFGGMRAVAAGLLDFPAHRLSRPDLAAPDDVVGFERAYLLLND